MRLALSFAALLVLFGWILSRAISHSTLLQLHYDTAAQQHHIRLALWLFMAILFPLVAIGAWILVGRTLQPLRALSKQASDAETEFRLVSPSSDSEMVELVETLNGLLDRIKLSAEAKAHFYAAASHELRTPLQALAGHLETALSQERDAEEYRMALVEAQAQSNRLSTLTRDILMLHQLQSAGVNDSESADLSSSVSTALSEIVNLVETRELRLSVNIPDSLRIPGRQTYADIAVRNLIENAARHSLRERLITVRLTAEEFVIQNDSQSMENVDLESLFEPFGRTDSSRQSGTGGNGLGLAVCGAAAKANGWTVSLQRTENGLSATIHFMNPSHER
ncbi:MAG: ATP-binding protein [Fimbriimonadaceae bacterium]